MKKILWVKFGWSDYYRGGSIDGNFGWLKEVKGRKNEGRGHEAFNFMPGLDGTYYCYVPPQSKNYAPWDQDNEGWTVVCLAKNPRHPGIHIVGWYENATLLGDWEAPPANHPSLNVEDPDSTYEWTYCIKSNSAFFVPPERRVIPFSHPSVRRGKYSFLAGPNIVTSPNKQVLLKVLEAQLSKLRNKAIHNPTDDAIPDPELDPVDPLKGFGTAEHRKKVEKAAERAVVAYYQAKGFDHKDRTKEKCGYDFQFYKRSQSLHVEVKGTSSDVAGFFLTINEHAAGYQTNPKWRLAMVTHALSKTPVVQIFDAKLLKSTFDLTPYVYLGRLVGKTGAA